MPVAWQQVYTTVIFFLLQSFWHEYINKITLIFCYFFQETAGVPTRMVPVVWDADYRRYSKTARISALEGRLQLKLHKPRLSNLKSKKTKPNCNMKSNQGYFTKFEKLLKIPKQRSTFSTHSHSQFRKFLLPLRYFRLKLTRQVFHRRHFRLNHWCRIGIYSCLSGD